MGVENEDWNNDDAKPEDSTGSDEETSEDEEEEMEEEEECEFEDEVMNDSNKRKLNEQTDIQDGKQAKSARSESTKPPNMEELRNLKETQMLYHSNLFRMQMEEVLGEVSIKEKTSWQLQEWLTRFSAFLSSLPKSKNYELSENRWMKEYGVNDPVLWKLPNVKGTFFFAPPTKVEFVGSFASNTMTKLSRVLDVMVTLPEECVHASDWRNGRWLIKRIRYAAWIACSLQNQTDLVTDLHWTKQFGLSTRPVLQITPSGNLGKKWKMNIFPVPPPECFQVSRFSPLRWNIQPKWFFSKNPEGQVEGEPVTPRYNWACGVDVVMVQHAQLIKRTLPHQSNLLEGIKLIKIWLAQRQLDKGAGCFSGHMVTLLVIHLLQSRKINPQMSAYQIFRTVIVSLNTADWTKAGPNMGTFTETKGPTLEEFHQHYEVVFIDPSGMVNLATSLTTADFQRVKHEAGLAFTLLDTASDCFDSLFIKKVEMFQLSDQFLTITWNARGKKEALHRIKNHKEPFLDALGIVDDVLYPSLLKVLREGLGERALLVAPLRSLPDTWPVSQTPPKQRECLEVGLIFNPISAWTLLTKGPLADSPEAAAFREFWGEKCSLRRFQDGSFHEAVLWGDPKLSLAQRRLIPEQICQELLHHHFGIEKDAVSFINKQMEIFLHHRDYALKYKYATGEEATVLAIQSFDSLSRKLRSLDLPLKVSAVQSISDVNRHARVFPPIAKALCNQGQIIKVVDDHLEFSGDDGHCRDFQYAMEVIVLLEISGKWPDDVTAIQAVKAEFHCKMADMLKEDGITVQVYPDFLQILWEGYVFRVRVSYLREIYLRRLIETPEGHYKEQDTQDALYYEKHIDIMPKYTSALASIQAEHPSFSGGVRLCKRWVGSQLLLPHLPHIAVELLVAHLYLVPAPYSHPHTPHVTFLRFLNLLVHTDWKSTPLLVNLNEAFTDEDTAELLRRFTSQRSTLPHMFIVTPYELRNVPMSEDPTQLDQRYKQASFWTRTAPSPQILYRAKQLAGAALMYLNTNLLSSTFDAKVVFRPSWDDYDVIIRLAGRRLSRQHESLHALPRRKFSIKPYEKSAKEIMPIVMFDDAYFYLKELRDAFGHLALFFHDEHGGKFVGVVWKPTALAPQDLKVTNLEGHQVVGVKKLTQVANVSAIISDFHTLGQGLVRSVKVKST